MASKSNVDYVDYVRQDTAPAKPAVRSRRQERVYLDGDGEMQRKSDDGTVTTVGGSGGSSRWQEAVVAQGGLAAAAYASFDIPATVEHLSGIGYIAGDITGGEGDLALLLNDDWAGGISDAFNVPYGDAFSVEWSLLSVQHASANLVLRSQTQGTLDVGAANGPIVNLKIGRVNSTNDGWSLADTLPAGSRFSVEERF